MVITSKYNPGLRVLIIASKKLKRLLSCIALMIHLEK